MRRLLPLLLALPACTGIERPSDLAPGPHLMLAGLTQRSEGPSDPLVDPDDREPLEDETQGDPVAALDETPEPAARYGDGGPSGHSVGAKLRALEGKKQLYGRPVDDVSLLRAAFEGVRGIAPIDDLVSLRNRTVPRREGGFKEGDLIFFGSDAREVPAVAVVHRRIGSGTIEAAAVTRGAVRFIRVTPMYPHARRRKGQIANSYLRQVHANDPRGTAYLAGQLLEDVRVLVK